MSSHGYLPVQWNKRKKVYDLSLWLGIVAYLGLYIGLGSALHVAEQALSFEIILIRAFATCAFLMLTIILCIGPLARLDQRFLPLLYNRRHFGVSMCVIALLHGLLSTVWYHGYGVDNPLVALFTLPAELHSITDIPFQPFGVFALLVIILMAATSHDYWNANLGAPLWKALHMSVYVAYALIVIHIALGALQEPNTGFSALMLFASLLVVGGLHSAVAIKGAALDKGMPVQDWVDVGSWRDIQNNRAIVVTVGADERVAVFRYQGNKLAAVGNACQHQNGPLGEGKVIDDCITCPWHGFQYRPEDGCSPPPFTEKVATYALQLDGERVLLNPAPLPPGTARAVTEIPLIASEA